MQKSILAVFDDRDALERTMEDLAQAGIDRSQLSLLSAGQAAASHDASRSTAQMEREAPVTGPDEGNITGMMASVPAYIAAVAAAGVTIASGGTLAGVAIAALAAGAGGGAVGVGAARLLSQSVDERYEDKLREGGIVLVVSPQDEHERNAALRLLKASRAFDVSEHAAPPAAPAGAP